MENQYSFNEYVADLTATNYPLLPDIDVFNKLPEELQMRLRRFFDAMVIFHKYYPEGGFMNIQDSVLVALPVDVLVNEVETEFLTRIGWTRAVLPINIWVLRDRLLLIGLRMMSIGYKLRGE